ncbi:conserved exported hypothetical protein [Rubrivivax sp. A210]|uniref:DUF6600 domain-containing protein n=1 Tax=Rubrivivax sp. A210 TaxID=2772301 RepID=UPI001918ED39|nr:DUF6600 domain-containing protein [Rubrivivax sp. A210]CAD5369796.1 conserved exported hypothetical protein [Rubrivivax sp. A210]
MAKSFLTPLVRAWLAALALLLAPWPSAFAQDDPPGRVGRLAVIQGEVSWYDLEQGEWADAERNRPLTSGDRLVTAARATAEMRIGSTVVRLNESTELELTRIDDQRIALRLHRGSLALQVRSREIADEIALDTTEVGLQPLRAGLYRLDRRDETTHATALRGALRVDERNGFTIERGQRIELWREDGERGPLRSRFGVPENDGFAAWVASEDRRDERSESARHVSPEMTGAEELDRNGRWEQHPDYGAVWMPTTVRDDWAPYRYGRWTWVQPWGWTWVDDAPWGFAPFHYGRWVHWRDRWAWHPGDYVARPVYAPALVAWVGGPNFSVSINLGAPAVAWVPLAPREIYRPWYRATPRYEDRVNHRPHPGDRRARPPVQVPTGPIMYGNQGVPGGITAVPRDVLSRRQPVAREVLEERGRPRPIAVQPLSPLAPPPREALAPQPPREQRQVPNPGRQPQGVVDLRQQPPQQQRAPAAPTAPNTVIAVPERRDRHSEPDRGRERQRDEPREARRETPREAARDALPQAPVRPAVVAPAPQAAPQPAPLAAPQPAPQPAQPAPPRERPAAPPQQAPRPPPQPAAQPAPQPRPAPAVAPPPQPAAQPPAQPRPAEQRRDDERKDERRGGIPRERENLR